jgi:probable H4MPT-linked C1 transfer pathway protein
VPFALWRNPSGLANEIARLVESAPACERIAVTMTGELCDCFATKAEGVRHILAATQRASGNRDVRVYLVDGRLAGLDEALQSPELAAASNWHVLARFACRYVAGKTGLLIDIGSTTTDIVPLIDGLPRPRGLNDTDRLLSRELVYTGVGRTPVCAITRFLPWRGSQYPVAAELFATSADAYVILGRIGDQPTADWTADGQPLTAEFAIQRLARMICADGTNFTLGDAQQAAATVHEAQENQIGKAICRVVESMAIPPELVVLSGTGEFLATAGASHLLPGAAQVSLAQRLGSSVTEAAPAHALAVLAREGGQEFGCKKSLETIDN